MSIKKDKKNCKKERFDSETYINYLRSIGVKLGKGQKFLSGNYFLLMSQDHI